MVLKMKIVMMSSYLKGRGGRRIGINELLFEGNQRLVNGSENKRIVMSCCSQRNRRR